jgi:HPt (histidine-containing phosphotransfer) domain-containing protein
MLNEAFDQETLDTLRELGGDEFIAELMATFSEQAQEMAAALRSALDASDAHGFGRAAHALAGSSMNIGAMRLANVARSIEHEMQEDGAVPTEHHLFKLRDELAMVI